MIDWQLVIWRLRPTSEYHWKGDSSNGTYADIGEWRDPETTKPTEQECLDEWDVYLVEKVITDAEETQFEENETIARTGWKDLGDWIVTFTPDEAELYVRNQIFDGIEPSALDTWIDTNVTDLASARTALKFIGANIMTIRTILSIIAKVILYIRDILIKRL